MASIFKRKSKAGKGYTWRPVIRKKGHPIFCDTFTRKELAEDWARETEQANKDRALQVWSARKKANLWPTD